MNRTRSLPLFVLFTAGLACLMALTVRGLMSKIRFGLEFRGGYEIFYVVEPLPGETRLTPEALLKTANLLRKRADGIGTAEPEISLEGKNHIRLKIAGLTSVDQARSILGDPSGLPTRLKEKYTQSVGSVLGNTALQETLTGGAIGTALVILLLVILYRGAGLIASFCLLVYLWLMVVVFDAIHATLSLSAVVAFVLGIGMAADATIIGFERICEELRENSDTASAFREGFRASFRTVQDANLVTAIAMIALFVAGIGPIQGFSLTMLISMLISVLTNLLCVRVMCGMLARSEILSIGALLCRRPLPRPARRRVFDFVGLGRRTAAASVLIMAAGAWYYSAHGLNLDIDFTAGTALDIDIDRPIEQATVNMIMAQAGTVPATVSIGGENSRHIAARFDEILKPDELDRIIAAFKARYGSSVEYEENTADPGVAREFAVKAINAILAACASIIVFIGLRFSWPVALATLVSIAHDLLLVSAIFALFKLEIDVTYVAAMLTVMGYSLNDKIVIFDRIRENLKRRDRGEGQEGGASGREEAKDLANRSIRQTLGRSIYTVLTVVLASASLLIFGCEPLQMFSLAILLGLVSGAYSSIFLACPLWIVLRVPRASPRSSLAVVRL